MKAETIRFENPLHKLVLEHEFPGVDLDNPPREMKKPIARMRRQLKAEEWSAEFRENHRGNAVTLVFTSAPAQVRRLKRAARRHVQGHWERYFQPEYEDWTCLEHWMTIERCIDAQLRHDEAVFARTSQRGRHIESFVRPPFPFETEGGFVPFAVEVSSRGRTLYIERDADERLVIPRLPPDLCPAPHFWALLKLTRIEEFQWRIAWHDDALGWIDTMEGFASMLAGTPMGERAFRALDSALEYARHHPCDCQPHTRLVDRLIAERAFVSPGRGVSAELYAKVTALLKCRTCAEFDAVDKTGIDLGKMHLDALQKIREMHV